MALAPRRLISAPRNPVIDRRRFLTAMAGVATITSLTACRPQTAGSSPAKTALARSAPLPTTIPAGTELTIASASTTGTQLELQLAGLINSIPFKVPQWPNLSAGPDVVNAFRANSLDLGANAGIPPIQSHDQGGLDARIVAVRLTRMPTYVFVTKPHSDIQTVADFRGKKLAFSQGQAQGVVLLRAMKESGLKNTDATLVPLTSDQFLTALQTGQVDIVPIGITTVDLYLNQYGKDGAHKITTDVVDLLSILWAPGRVLENSAKATAIAAFIPIWAKGWVWQWENQDTWVQKFYVENQGITAAQGKAIMAASNKPLFPPTWDEAISWEQETIQLLADAGLVKPFKAEDVFDRRFESLAASAVTETYRS